jgi:predicted AAA+ superfamily ATPase
MIPRHIETALRQRMSTTAPAVVLLGPRQVGKTTLARKIAADWPTGALYLDTERPADRRRLDEADAYLRAQTPKLVVIDEIHRVPELFATLRGIIDERRQQGQRFGHFLLLGSAALDRMPPPHSPAARGSLPPEGAFVPWGGPAALMRQASETLAGRVAYLDMGPVDMTEAGSAGLPERQLWLRGGFPDSLLAADDAQSFDWRQDFIRSYLERDVPMFAPRLPAQTLGRLWTMLAHQQGGLLNQARLAASLGVSEPTVGRYIDLLCDLHLTRRLTPWAANVGKRLVGTPKVYVRDSGLVHALLGLGTEHDLLGHPVAGASYEGFALETLIQCAGNRYRAHFYRTHDGAEIDLVLERGGRAEMAIEVKRSSAPSTERGFTEACEALGLTQRWVVYPGQERFPLRHGAQAIGLADLASQLAAGG